MPSQEEHILRILREATEPKQASEKSTYIISSRTRLLVDKHSDIWTGTLSKQDGHNPIDWWQCE
jgi:hypothetical protein